MTDVVLQYFDGCPNWAVARDRITNVLDESSSTLTLEQIDTIEQAIAAGFRGSPTILIDGTDPFSNPDAPVGLACRIYTTDAGTEGSPSVAQLQQALELPGTEASSWSSTSTDTSCCN